MRSRSSVDNLAAQYDGYEALPGLKVNGRLTLGENIGDLGGLTVALRGVPPVARWQGRAGARRPHAAISASSCPGPRPGAPTIASSACATR